MHRRRREKREGRIAPTAPNQLAEQFDSTFSIALFATPGSNLVASTILQRKKAGGKNLVEQHGTLLKTLPSEEFAQHIKSLFADDDVVHQHFMALVATRPTAPRILNSHQIPRAL